VWANTPLSFSYQWQQCDATGANCSNINKATAGDYVASQATWVTPACGCDRVQRRRQYRLH